MLWIHPKKTSALCFPAPFSLGVGDRRRGPCTVSPRVLMPALKGLSCLLAPEPGSSTILSRSTWDASLTIPARFEILLF